MKIALKQRIGTVWKPVKIESLVGGSIMQMMIDTNTECVAAVYAKQEDEKPSLIISNDEKTLKYYEERGMAVLSIFELASMVGNDPIPNILVNTFKDSDFISASTIDTEGKMENK